MLRNSLAALALVSVILLAGCGDSAPPAEVKKEAPKKPTVPEGAIPALTAYNEVYKVARKLAPDVQTASLTGTDVDGVKNEEGKYAQWTIVFVSASKMEAYTFVYSTVEKGNILRGLNNQGSMRWAGPNQNALPFSNSDFSIDSTAAYKTAAEKAKDWLAKNETKPVTTFALGMSSKFAAPMWFIQWGDKKGGYAAFVNAATGAMPK